MLLFSLYSWWPCVPCSSALPFVFEFLNSVPFVCVVAPFGEVSVSVVTGGTTSFVMGATREGCVVEGAGVGLTSEIC